MSVFVRLGALLLPLLLLAPVLAEDEPSGGQIAWSKDLPTAFKTAKANRKPILVCVNARTVKGGVGEEPAAKGLREVVYKDPRVVEKSKAFVCVMLTRQGTAEDFGELRALGIDGDITSPQHLFVHPSGERILLRKVYWSHGKGEEAVQKLLGMMEKALERLKAAGDGAGAGGGAVDGVSPPPEGEGRAAWIQDMVGLVLGGNEAQRDAALAMLLEHDQDGDCIAALIALLEEHKKNLGLVVLVVRALGRDGLEAAALPLTAYLKHKDPSVRGNAAVSLEYVGSREKKVVGALKSAAGKEKDAAIANHMYRALGRCGVKDAKARALLLKKADGAKSEFASYGPTIGLAYFEADTKAARGVEKILKKIGIPGGKRGGTGNTVRRTVLAWTLANIGDRKSAAFVREELLARLENMKAFWVDGLRGFYENVAAGCEGQEGAMQDIVNGVRFTVGIARGGGLGRYGAETRSLMDDCRLERDSTFKPLGDHLLERGGGN